MILVNVLLIVALAAAVLALMLAGGTTAVQRSTRLREAARAMAIARGGELSAIAALRRDAAAGRATDNAGEAWAKIGDREAEIVGGTFSFELKDAQDRFNINALVRNDLTSRTIFERLAVLAGIKKSTTREIASQLGRAGPITNLARLGDYGVSEAELGRLTRTVTALPTNTSVNLNSVGEPLMTVLLGNAASARALIRRRERQGRLTSEDLAAERAFMPPGTSWTSDYFWARGRVTIGDTSQQLVSLLHRRSNGGRPQVVAVLRWRGAAAPVQAPALP